MVPNVFFHSQNLSKKLYGKKVDPLLSTIENKYFVSCTCSKTVLNNKHSLLTTLFDQTFFKCFLNSNTKE